MKYKITYTCYVQSDNKESAYKIAREWGTYRAAINIDRDCVISVEAEDGTAGIPACES